MSHHTEPVSQRKLEANRSNARKSTGPKTEQGKQKSKLNAVKHGYFCEDLLLEGEDRAQFLRFKHGVFIRLGPRDELELSLVERVVECQWKLKRLRAAEGMLLRDRASRLEASADARQIGLGGFGAIRAAVAGWRPPPPEHPTPHADEVLAGMLRNDPAPLQTTDRYQRRLENTVERTLKLFLNLKAQQIDYEGPNRLVKKLMEADGVTVNHEGEVEPVVNEAAESDGTNPPHLQAETGPGDAPRAPVQTPPAERREEAGPKPAQGQALQEPEGSGSSPQAHTPPSGRAELKVE